MLAQAAGLERRRSLATAARVAAFRAARRGAAGPHPRRGRLQPPAGHERRAGYRPVTGGPRQDRQQGPPDRRNPRHPAGRDHHRRQPQRRYPADAADRGRVAGAPEPAADPDAARGTCAPTVATTTSPTAIRYAPYRSRRTLPGAAPTTAPAWACTDGSSKARSRCCTGSDDCASAGRYVTTSTRASSPSAAPSSAGGDFAPPFVRSHKGR